MRRYRAPARRRSAASVYAALVGLALLISGCAAGAVGGVGTFAPPSKAANVSASQFKIIGDGGTGFDQLARNSLTDVEQFWAKAFPSVSGGSAFKPLSGGVYSVTTGRPNPAEECMAKAPTAANNNAFYCSLDDAFVYDRIGLVKIVTQKVGVNFAPLVFAHEFGHLIQNRLKIDAASILLESQADCASGAFMATEAGVGTVTLTNRHFVIDPKSLDDVAIGMILLRDYSPHSAEDQGSHGNGFDRLSAFSDGFDHGAAYCYRAAWKDRKFTERGYAPGSTDEQNQGNEPLSQVLDPSPSKADGTGGGGLQPQLNKYWTTAFTTIKKTFKPVAFKPADSPPCGPSSARLGYCANDNTVYYNQATAAQLYNSMPVLAKGPAGQVTVAQNAPGDYLLGALLSMEWGMAVRSQLGLPTDSDTALLGASCYAGAFAESINSIPDDGKPHFALSPQDMDEASVAVMQQADQPTVFGPRNTTAFERIASFKKGYFGTLTACT